MALHFSKEEFSKRKKDVLISMKEQNLDALLMFRQESMYWLTGYDTFGFVFFQTLIIDQKGNIIFEAPEEAEYINVPNNVRVVEMKDGVATTIVEAQDNTAKTVKTTESERGVNAAFDQLLGQDKVDNQAVNFIKDSIPQLASVFESMDIDTPFNQIDIDSTEDIKTQIHRLQQNTVTETTD